MSLLCSDGISKGEENMAEAPEIQDILEMEGWKLFGFVFLNLGANIHFEYQG